VLAKTHSELAAELNPLLLDELAEAYSRAVMIMIIIYASEVICGILFHLSLQGHSTESPASSVPLSSSPL
jgi:hypothetical protein